MQKHTRLRLDNSDSYTYLLQNKKTIAKGLPIMTALLLLTNV